MTPSPRRRTRAVSRTIALVTVLTLAPLLAWHASPLAFPERAHDALAAIPLALIAVACVVHPVARRAPWIDTAKAVLLAAAFLFWAANQFWPDHPLATLFNDVAVALFVVDVVLAIFGWSAAEPGRDASAPESAKSDGQPQALAE